mgnify:CR=1 FL=1
MDSEQVYVLTKGRHENSDGAEIKIAEIKISLGEIPYYPFLPNGGQPSVLLQDSIMSKAPGGKKEIEV